VFKFCLYSLRYHNFKSVKVLTLQTATFFIDDILYSKITLKFEGY